MTCEGPNCGLQFEARMRTARFCGERCRKRASRASKRQPTISLTASVTPLRVADKAVTAEDESVTAAVRTELADIGRLRTVAGRRCLVLAGRLDGSASESGGSVGSLDKQLSAALAEAYAAAADEPDELDLIQDQALTLLVSAGG